MAIRQCDLDAAQSPESVAQILRDAADKYRESVPELQSAWQDARAGRVWNKIAAALETAARRCDKICENGY